MKTPKKTEPESPLISRHRRIVDGGNAALRTIQGTDEESSKMYLRILGRSHTASTRGIAGDDCTLSLLPSSSGVRGIFLLCSLPAIFNSEAVPQYLPRRLSGKRATKKNTEPEMLDWLERLSRSVADSQTPTCNPIFPNNPRCPGSLLSRMLLPHPATLIHTLGENAVFASPSLFVVFRTGS